MLDNIDAVIFDNVHTIKKELLITTQAKNIINDIIAFSVDKFKSF